MIAKLIPYLWKKGEPAITVLFLLVISDVPLPGPFSKLVSVGSYGIVALLILPHWRRLLYVASRDLLLWSLLGVALFSYFWSADPGATTASAKALVRSMVFGVYLATRYTPMEQMHLFAWMTGLGAILSAAIGAAIPSYGQAGGLWRGIYAHKQYLGRMMVVGAATQILTFISCRKYRWLNLMILVLALALILLSQSKTALVLYVFSISALPLYQMIRYYYKTQVVLYLLFLLVGGAIAVFVAGNWEMIVVDVLGKSPNFTGREEVWELAFDQSLQRPWLGYGYAGFWGSPEGDFVMRHTWAAEALARKNETGGFHAHNGFLDLFLWLGGVGLVLFVVHYITVLIRVIRLFRITKGVEYFWMLQIIALMLLYNTTEVVLILSQGHQLWLAYIAISFSSALQLERIRRSPPQPSASEPSALVSQTI
nr:O-antigen ligase family protein [Oculatella sp. LEGE 06141]